MNHDDQYITPKHACERIGISQATLRRMADANEIPSFRTNSGRYLYNVSKFIKTRDPEIQVRKKICYARVSGRAQKPDLQNQINLLASKYPTHEIITDYGSGLNFKRKGLQKILDLGIAGKIEEIVVTYKDRLCRFGFELIESILKKQSNAKIVVLSHNSTSPESELASDLLSIITVFGARMYGLRKYKSQIKDDKGIFKETFPTETKTTNRKPSLSI